MPGRPVTAPDPQRAAFVGRRAELQRLTGLWDAAVGTGDIRTVLVGGEPGVGKTSLVLRLGATMPDATVLYGRADDPLTPYQAWITALRPLGFTDTFRDVVAHVSDPAVGRTLLFESVVEAVTATAPALVVLDDAQWADESTLALVRHVAKGGAAGPLLLVVVYRDTEVPPPLLALIADLSSEPHVDRVAVVGLTEDEIAELTGRDDIGELVERTGGNPFLLAALGSHDLDGRPPPAVSDVVLGRVARLGAEGQKALTAAAVCGRRVPVRVVEAIVGADALGHLEGAARAGLLVGVDEDAYEFVHDLVRECIVDALPPARRARLHRQVADALHAGDGATPAVDHHRLAAGGDDALAAAIRAADRARAELAYETAAAHRRTAFELSTDSAVRYRLAVAEAEERALAGSVAGELQALHEALAVARELGDASLAAAALARMPLTFAPEHDLTQAVAQTLDELGPEDSAVRARLLIRQFYEATNAALPTDVVHIHDDAVAMAERVGDGATLARAVVARSIFFADQVRQEDLDVLARHEAEMAEVFGTRTLRRSRALRITRKMALGDADGARRDVATLVAGGLSEASQWTVGEWRAVEAFLAGRFDEALRMSAEAARHGEALGEDMAWSNHRLLDLHVAIERGQAPSGALDVPLITGGLARMSVVFDAKLAALAGDVPTARRLLEGLGADEVPHITWAPILFTWAESVALIGDAPRAAALYERLQTHSGTVVMPPLYPSFCLGAADRLLGLLAEAAGRAVVARTHLNGALELDTRIGADVWAAHDRLHLARLTFADEPERAMSMLDAAASEARRMGMRRLADQVGQMRSTSLLRADANGWVAVFDGTVVRLPARRGLGWVSQLLARPGEEIAALDLAGGGSWDRPPAFDDEAKQRYRRRLAELDAEIDAHVLREDGLRAEASRVERDALVAELSRAAGLGGRDRTPTADSERARVNVTRAIRRGIAEIAALHPSLAAHLDATIRTGLFCSYTPDPRSPVTWTIRSDRS